MSPQRSLVVRFFLKGGLVGLLVGLSLAMAYQAWGAVPPHPRAARAAAEAPTPVPWVIAYQGTLTDADGNPINDNLDMVFRIYNVDTGGTPLWVEEHTGENAVPVQEGLFQVYLGSLQPFPEDLWANGTLYLGVQIGADEEMSPREVISSVAWAVKASTADQAATAVSANQAELAVDVAEEIGHRIQAPVLAAEQTDRGRMYIVGNSGNDEGNTSGELTFTDRSFSPEHYYQLAYTGENELQFAYYDGSSWLWNAVFEGPAGNLRVRGSISQGAIIERNLQTAEEREAETIPRFEQGDVLCWVPAEHRLGHCTSQASPLVVAVADPRGKPIVLGAELIKAVGPVQPGDLLVASEVPGYAVAWSQVGTGDPPPGTVIAKALEGLGPERGLILALILER